LATITKHDMRFFTQQFTSRKRNIREESVTTAKKYVYRLLDLFSSYIYPKSVQVRKFFFNKIQRVSEFK